MPLNHMADPEAIRKAARECNEMGTEAFLQKYAFGRTRYMALVDGKRYPGKALVAAAHGYEFPEEGPLEHGQISGGQGGTNRILRRLGFEIVDTRQEKLTPPEGGPSVWIEVTRTNRSDRLPVRVERLVGDLDPDGDPIDFGEVRRREDRVHAFGRARNARVHLAQVRVRDLRTDHAEPQLTGEVDVVDEATVAYQQAGVLDPEQRPGARHGCVAGSATASAARRTARRMFW